MPDPSPDDPGSVPVRLMRWSYARSRGPGGQNVNKVNSKATLRVALADLDNELPASVCRRVRSLGGRWITAAGDLMFSSDTHRTREANRQACIGQLERLIARARVRPKKRRATKPSRASKERRLQAKRHRGQIKARRRGRPSAD